MNHQATIVCPPDIYDPALKLCNELRAKKGLEPLDALPAGYPGEADSCPCGKASGFWFYMSNYSESEDVICEELPHDLKFPSWFDGAANRGVLTLPVRGEG